MQRAGTQNEAADPSPKPHVLVVDDDRPLAQTMRRHLTQLGCSVEVAHEGEGAVARISRDAFDVVLLDLCMQPTDGWFVMDRVRKMEKRPRVIVVSGSVDVATAVQAMHHGAGDVLEKPVALDALVRRILANLPPKGRSAAYPSPGDAADRLLGTSLQLEVVREKIRSVARYRDIPVLIVGETGTGKEVVAQAIHELSGAAPPLVALNCAAIPEQLFESELFGHEVGAFTGSRGARRGLLEDAADGTIFLDEVGEMSSAVQAKLLRALETRRFRRVGANTDTELGARIVSATHRCSGGATDGALRPDLYYRLSAFTIELPPLRARPGDIEVLARHFLAGFSRRYQEPIKQLSTDAIALLRGHAWPGNVRELRSVIDRAAVIARTDVVGAPEIIGAIPSLSCGRNVEDQDALATWSAPKAEPPRLRDVERRMILETFERSGRNLSDAARQLGLPRSTLRDRLRRFEVG